MMSMEMSKKGKDRSSNTKINRSLIKDFTGLKRKLDTCAVSV